MSAAPVADEAVAEAFEAAIARGDLPAHWADPSRAPRWPCSRCFGRCYVWRDAGALTRRLDHCDCAWALPSGTLYSRAVEASPSAEALAFVVAVGRERLVIAEELVAAVAPRVPIVWRPADVSDVLRGENEVLSVLWSRAREFGLVPWWLRLERFAEVRDALRSNGTPVICLEGDRVTLAAWMPSPDDALVDGVAASLVARLNATP